MKNWLEKQFRLSEFHTDVKTEILAGLTTFVTIPAFLCVTFTIFANNIANGICVALPAYLVMKIATGKIKKIDPVMYVLVAVCLLYFYSIV